jgi:hypothetical protein
MSTFNALAIFLSDVTVALRSPCSIRLMYVIVHVSHLIQALLVGAFFGGIAGLGVCDALENEKKHRDDYGVFSVVSSSRVNTLVTPRGVEPLIFRLRT